MNTILGKRTHETQSSIETYFSHKKRVGEREDFGKCLKAGQTLPEEGIKYRKVEKLTEKKRMKALQENHLEMVRKQHMYWNRGIDHLSDYSYDPQYLHYTAFQ
jgi:hypothetical protein